MAVILSANRTFALHLPYSTVYYGEGGVFFGAVKHGTVTPLRVRITSIFFVQGQRGRPVQSLAGPLCTPGPFLTLSLVTWREREPSRRGNRFPPLLRDDEIYVEASP